jgi:iodotyrosine deiodinase
MGAGHRPLDFARLPPDEMRRLASAHAAHAARRRSVREFSGDAIPLDVVRDCIRAAATAPSGANKQPWTFVLVTDPEVKRRIREAAEAEERAFYGGRAPQRWLDDLAPLGTGPSKPFLEDAPALIVVFAQRHGAGEDERHYYVQESVGIATGMLLAALHHAGLATLTHTPSPMGFLAEVLGRPARERPYLLIPVGYPAPGCRVPDIAKKALEEVLVEVGPPDGSSG